MIPAIVAKLHHRWAKRVFANDDIFCHSLADGYWEVGIRRGNKEAVLTIAPNAYQKPRFMLNADKTMRFALMEISRKDD